MPRASAAGCGEGRDLRLWSCWTPGAPRQAVKFHHYPFLAVLAFYRRFTAGVDGGSASPKQYGLRTGEKGDRDVETAKEREREKG